MFARVLVQVTIQLVRNPGSHERSAIAASLIEFNASRIGRPTEDKLLALTVTEPETGNIIGGLWGSTIHDHLHVDLLVVPEALRHGGIGRRLMALAEQEAIDRGCRGAWLTTHSFQARGFYERLGYEAFGIMDDFPPGHSFIFLRKRFETPGDVAR
ncbi:GNAT family N-acetyltransferase [Rhizobium sp. CF122]|uniref:GNAT family N-acetyltransferase n=1 Tax=Rhizobium sp. CF122 TaxID=1144312 RepID=UPI0012F769B0